MSCENRMTSMTFTRRFIPPMSSLCAFEAAARLESFTAAGLELNLTQSAISRQIRQLEDLLGSDLFIRHRQTVKLTQAGEAYAYEIRDVLSRVSGATLGFRANPAGGTLNLAVLPTFGTRWLAPRLPDFFARHPDIKLNLVTRPGRFDFASDMVDAAIHCGDAYWPGGEMEILMGEQVAPVCSPALLARYDLRTPADLLKCPLIHLRSRPDAWERWFAAMDVPDVQLHGMLVDQFMMAAEIAAAGLGLAMIPQRLIENELQDRRLVLASAAPIASGNEYFLVWQEGKRQYAPLQAFKSWLLSVIQYF